MNNIDVLQNTVFPEITLTNEAVNPTLISPNNEVCIQFYQTRETFLDTELYRDFLKNSISRFRTSVLYTHYKGFLMSQGLDRCQMLGNITAEMATIEMHHNMLTIFDIALIISEHIINTYGKISTFDLTELLGNEHRANRIQLVMLCLTSHQLYHNDEDLFIHPSMTVGDWKTFLELYRDGITQDIAFKILFYLKRALEQGGSDDGGLLDIRDKVMDWSLKNVQLYYR